MGARGRKPANSSSTLVTVQIGETLHQKLERTGATTQCKSTEFNSQYRKNSQPSSQSHRQTDIKNKEPKLGEVGKRLEKKNRREYGGPGEGSSTKPAAFSAAFPTLPELLISIISHADSDDNDRSLHGEIHWETPRLAGLQKVLSPCSSSLVCQCT